MEETVKKWSLHHLSVSLGQAAINWFPCLPCPQPITLHLSELGKSGDWPTVLVCLGLMGFQHSSLAGLTNACIKPMFCYPTLSLCSPSHPRAWHRQRSGQTHSQPVLLSMVLKHFCALGQAISPNFGVLISSSRYSFNKNLFHLSLAI